MAYTKQSWVNSPATSTPISAERLNHLETQYDEAVSVLGAQIALVGQGAIWGNIDGNLLDQVDISNALDIKEQQLTAGANIFIDRSDPYSPIISVVDIDVTGATWGAIAGTITAQSDLMSRLNAKEYTLVAGTNVSIDRSNPSAPVINAAGGGGGGGGSSTVEDITDATATGKLLMKAADPAAVRSIAGLGAAEIVLVWSGTGYRFPGAGSDLVARPLTNPIHLIGGSVGDRPGWVNQDGDSHDVTA